MTRVTTPSRILAVALVALLLAGPAFAEGKAEPQKDGDFVSRLTDAERARLERSASWDRMDDARRQKIARAVIDMRDMTPEERERFAQRIERYQAARRRDPDGELPERMRSWRERGRRHHREVHALARGTADAVLERLSKPRRKALRSWGVLRGREVAFYRMLLEAAAAPYVEGEAAFDLSLVPERYRSRVERLIESADRRQRGRLAYLYVGVLAAGSLEGLHRPLREPRKPESPAPGQGPGRGLMGAQTRAYYEAIGQRLAERFPAAIDGVVARIEALSSEAEAREVFDKYGRPLHRGGSRGRGGDAQQRAAVHVYLLLDAPRTLRAKDDAERARIREASTPYLRYLLVEQLGISADDAESALALEGDDRRSAVRALVGDRPGRRQGAGRGPGGGRRR